MGRFIPVPGYISVYIGCGSPLALHADGQVCIFDVDAFLVRLPFLTGGCTCGYTCTFDVDYISCSPPLLASIPVGILVRTYDADTHLVCLSCGRVRYDFARNSGMPTPGSLGGG